MTSIQHVRLCAHRAVAAALAVLGLAASSVAGSITASTPAAAHARISATSPADGTDVEALPDRVTVTFTAKPATVEGDPLRVYDPSGRRIDDGDVRSEHGGEELSVGLPAGAATAGRYAVAYHVVSADSHLVAGRFAFTVSGGGPAVSGPLTDRRPHPAGPADVRPELAVTCAAVATVAIRLRRSRGARGPGSSGPAAARPSVAALAPQGGWSSAAGTSRAPVP